MSIRKLGTIFLLIAASVVLLFPPAKAAERREDLLVGRIEHTEGQLFRFIEEEKDWVLTGQDAPFGLEDVVYSGEESKAEFIFPNLTWVRIGENTQLQMMDLADDATTLDVASGSARLYNKSRTGVIKATTPFGYVVAEGDTVFDLYVGDESLEVIAVQGTVDFVHKETGRRSAITEGEASIIADKQGTAQGNGAVESDWDDWNSERDALWEQRQRSQGTSADLLPEPIRDEAYTLEENGRWERVYYEGSYRDMWRPTVVESGWRPYTAGRWVVYYRDNCWVPAEPFGYVTHHYGSWVYVDSFHTWYWMPPAVPRPPRSSAIYIGFGWYPGRVGWFHSGENIGWVPLAPDEVYYGYRPWGHRTVVVDRSVNITVNIGKYRYLDGAVVVHRDHLYRGERYTQVVQPHFDRRMIASQFKPAAVISAAVMPEMRVDPRRYTLHDQGIGRKPHDSVLQRIDVNQRLRRDAGQQNRKRIVNELERAAGTAPGSIPQTAIRTPTVTSKLVEAAQAGTQLDPSGMRRREIKPQDRQRQITPSERRLPPQRHDTQGLPPQERGDRANPSPDDRRPQPHLSKPVAPRDAGSAEGQLRSQGREQETFAQPEPGERPRSRPAEEERRIRSPRERQEPLPADRQPETPAPRQLDPTSRQPRPLDDLGHGRIKQESERQLRSPRDGQTLPAEQPALSERGPQNHDRRLPDNERDLRRRDNAQTQIEAAQQKRPDQVQPQPEISPPHLRDSGQQRQLPNQPAEQERQAQEEQRRQHEVIKAQQAEAAQQQRQAEIQRQKLTEMQQRQQAEEHQRRQQAEQERQAQEEQRRQHEAIKAQQAEAAQQQRQAEIQRQKQAEMQQRQQAEEHQRRQQAEQERRSQEEQRRQHEAIKAQQADAAQRQRQAEIQRQKQAEMQQRQGNTQQPPEQPRKGKKKLTPEEERLLEQQRQQQQ